jgi:PAS domain S-box-containing protein
MSFDFPPFAIAYVFTAGVSIVVAYLAWRRRSTPGGLSIALLMLGVTEWALTAALEIGSVGEAAKLFWSKIEYVGTVSSSVLFLIFALQYTRQEKWLTRRNVVLLWVIPLITLVMAATNEMHHWIWSRTEPSPVGNNLLVYHHGPWFWVNAAYAYACIIVGIIALIRVIVRSPNVYRQQASAMLASALVPFLGNVIYLFVNPIPGFDVTPIAFALTGGFVSWSMFRYHLLDLVPVARDVLIESLTDGVLVLDAQNRIADINPAAQQLVGVSAAVIGQHAETALAGWPELARLCCEPQETLAEISTGDEILRYLELRTSFLRDRRGQLTGRLLVLHDITERKDTENRLRRLSRAVEQSPASIVITDTAGRIEYVNPKFVEVTGYTFEEVHGKNPRILKSGEMPPEGYKQLWSTITSGGEWRGEFHNKKKNGELYWEVASISPLMNETGIITHFLAVKEDITERKRAEEALQESEQRYRTLIENQGEGICFVDLEERFMFANPAGEHIFGVPPGSLAGRSLEEFMSAEQFAIIQEQTLKRRTGETSTYEIELIRPDGQMRDVLVTAAPQFDSERRFTGAFAIFRDITDRKRAEEALRSSEERFRQLAENIHDVFWISTPDWSQMLYVSQAYEELWGCTCESLYEHPMSFLDIVYPQDRRCILDALEKLKSGEPAFSEYRIVRVDGSVGWMRSRIFPIRNEAGEVYRAAGITEDVTELKRAEEEIRHALVKEKELGELKSRFVSMTSHEFRTPLSSILGSAELLERFGHKWPEEKKLQHLHKIRASVKNMVQLLEDVLIIGKAEAGKIEFHPTPLDLEQFCRGLIEEMQLQAGAKHTLTFISRGQCAGACVDEKLLRQILANLLSNAIKYSPQGGAVQLELDCQVDQALFRVQDQGIGIPPEAQERLFDTFHRAGNVGNIPGTGLGMSIVKKSVDLHGGTLSFTSQMGVGTTFTVVIPLHLVEEKNT